MNTKRIRSGYLIFAGVSTALLAGLSAQAARPGGEFLLWTGSAPGALGTNYKDMPTLTPYYAEGTNATGAAMIVCPGGGYSFLADPHEGGNFAQWLNEQGISAFVLKYRLGSDGYHAPAQLYDVQRAVRYVRANAEDWALDPDRVGIIGSSAGGHLAATAIVHFDEGNPGSLDPIEQVSCRPDLGVLCYPVITMHDPYAHAGSRSNLLGPAVDDPSEVDYYSCELQVTTNTPQTFIFHTLTDTTVPYQNSTLFAAALASNEVPHELHLYSSGGHGIGLGSSPGSTPYYHDWVRECSYWLYQQGFGVPHLGKIWLLGDSITYGHGVQVVAGGYRDPLYQRLNERGYDFRFVGSRTQNSTTLLTSRQQNAHDGWGGYTIADISGYVRTASGLYDQLSSWMPTNTPPDLILMMIGINDLNQDFDVDTAPDRLDLLITRIFEFYPQTRLLIANLPEAEEDNQFRSIATNNLSASISDYNAAMASIVAGRQADGQSIALVDMHAEMTLDDLQDGLHPDVAGYAKMGGVWADAIEEPPVLTHNSIDVAGGTASITARGTVGSGYSFWMSSDLIESNTWTRLTSDHLRINPVTIEVPAADTQGFYRFDIP